VAPEGRAADVLGQAAELLLEVGRMDLAVGLHHRVAQAGDRSGL
jgi:hypothetical protein